MPHTAAMTAAKRKLSCLSCDSYDTCQMPLTRDTGIKKASQNNIMQVITMQSPQGNPRPRATFSLLPHPLHSLIWPKATFSPPKLKWTLKGKRFLKVSRFIHKAWCWNWMPCQKKSTRGASTNYRIIGNTAYNLRGDKMD